MNDSARNKPTRASSKPEVAKVASDAPASRKRVSSKESVAAKASAGKPRTRRSGRHPDVSPEEFLNRELQWLRFNERVLHEALDDRTPLLERVFFLGIFTSNLDEFMMKRVGGLKRQVSVGVMSRTPDGLTPQQQLTAIREMTLPMLRDQGRAYTEMIKPALAEHNIHLLHWDKLTKAERKQADDYFERNVFPVLTPLSVDPGHPFPFLSNLSLSLGVTLRHPDADEKLFARVKVPEVLPRWVQLKQPEGSSQIRFMALEDIIRHNLDDLFPGMVVMDVMPFRITRNADVDRDEEDAEDLLEMVAAEVRQRRFEKVIRLEHGPDPDPWMLRFLSQELELADEDIYELPAPLLDYTDLRPVHGLDLPQLKFPKWTSIIPPALADEDTDVFALIRRGDLLMHHPYESFTASVQRFVKAAADDPKVLAIKMTLYRTGDDSPFINTLIRAAEQGKQVVCLVELKARFDEQRNVQLAKALEKAGVHVVYGVIGFKTHTKAALVVRREQEGLRCYAHIGTGNYHPGTAKLYTDLGLLTADPTLTNDMVELFHYLTGRSLKRDYEKLLVAPVNMRTRFEEMIEREIEHHQAGRPARIVAKMNSLEHRGICRALYRASEAGVPIDLIVRGFCCLRPGVPGLSENIRVLSVIGRFLEHSRIFYFRNGAEAEVDGEFYIGSADWMYRNLHGRIELITPIDKHAHRERLWEIIQIMLNDHRQCWEMHADGHYTQRQAPEGVTDKGTHVTLMELTQQRALHG